MLFDNLRISRKLTVSFAAIALTIGAMGAVTLVNLRGLGAASRDIEESSATLLALGEANFYMTRQENSFRGFLLSANPYYIERVNKHRGNFKLRLNKLRELVAENPELKAQVDTAEQAADKWFAQVVEGGQVLAADPATHQQAVDMVGPDGLADSLIGPAENALEAIAKAETEHMAVVEAKKTSQTRAAYTAILTGLGVVLLIAITLGWLLTSAIATPVASMTRAMRRLADGDNNVEVPAIGRRDEVGEMAAAVEVFKDAALAKLALEGETAEQRRAAETERARNEAAKAAAAAAQGAVVASLANGLERLSRGDLTVRLTDAFPPDYIKLQTDFNAAMTQLHDAMSAVVGNVSAIRSGVSEITQASDDLSKRTEHQAASLEETAAALDEIVTTVRRTADGAKQAANVVAAARGDANTSGEVVRNAVTAMSAIESSAKEISQIIGVIDEIAFQTNLLALNAGVEAARAGDAGRGFAVVASEVRALAQRSAEAAKEIKSLIGASTAQVGSGVQLVGETGEALQRIVGRVEEIDGLVAEIAASAQEQATGLAEVNTAVNQMDQVTQQNAAMVEQSSAAAHSLDHEADVLASSVARFTIGEAADPHAAASVRRGPAAPARHAVPQMRTTAQGSALRRAAAAPQTDTWEEF